MSERPAWPISRAADECGVSRDTIKRRREHGDFPNATQDNQRRWLIPVDDLIAAGLRPGKPRTSDQLPQGTALGHTTDALGHAPGAHAERITQLEHENQLLRARLDAEQQLRTAAERNAADLRTSLRMLETSPNTTTQPTVQADTPSAATTARRRWFTRRQMP